MYFAKILEDNMKYIYLNLKRFDVPKTEGGANDIGTAKEWGKNIVEGIAKGIEGYDGISFAAYLPEGYIIQAADAEHGKLEIGCQGVFENDVEVGGNFGAFTTLRTAKSAKFLGATTALIGHCEERNNLKSIITLGGGNDLNAVNVILNREIKRATAQGMKVLYCIGETSEEQDRRYEVFKNQLETGLDGVDLSLVTVAYEPVWAIGPGKTPPDSAYIEDVVKYVKSVKPVSVVYGGGLKKENAPELAKIKELDGGLIALTRFGKDFGFSVPDYLEIVRTYSDNLE